MITKGDEVASLLIQERGYLVVGLLKSSGKRPLGYKLMEFCSMDLSQPIVIVSETTREDWIEQERAAQCFRNDPNVPHADGKPREAWFYRAVTD